MNGRSLGSGEIHDAGVLADAGALFDGDGDLLYDFETEAF
jgi:hypothetical protein